MKKLDLNKVADEFEMISNDTHVFYNTETGEFDHFSEFDTFDDEDSEHFEEDCWIAAPSQRDIHEYGIMADFAATVTDPHANELLCVALEGRGAFRRFKDTLHRVGLLEQWYAYKHDAYVELAREWCEENEIPFEDTQTSKSQADPSETHACAEDAVIIPLVQRIADDAAEVLRDALYYSKQDAAAEVKRMLSSKRIALAAITADMRVTGIIGAISQYGVTGWELHPLAVRKEYQRRGFGSLLVQALESEVAARGGVMIYLGSDDETGTTSLYGADLYDDTFDQLSNIQNIGGHPFSFYEKLGYKIVGVFPDANGIGKPDIWMAKRIV